MPPLGELSVPTYPTQSETHDAHETPWYGSRQMARHLRRLGYCVGRKRVRRLMRLMGLAPIYQKPRTIRPDPEHRFYPYLLRGLAIGRAN